MIEFVIVIDPTDFICVKVIIVCLLVIDNVHNMLGRKASVLVAKNRLGLSIMVKTWIVVDRLS
jgi:hypothetical protein